MTEKRDEKTEISKTLSLVCHIEISKSGSIRGLVELSCRHGCRLGPLWRRAVLKFRHSFVHPKCILHFITHPNLFFLINLGILELHMKYLILKKKTKLLSYRKSEFLKTSVTSKAQKPCILSFIPASRYLPAI